MIPATIKPRSIKFYYPPYIQGDFAKFLNTDIPNVNYTFEIIPDWYLAKITGYQPYFIRAMRSPIDWKSKMGNTDMTTNFLAGLDASIKKGDMVKNEDGTYFIINWVVQEKVNAKTTQILECNAITSFKRSMPDVLDGDGFVTTPSYEKDIAEQIPCSFSKYQGRPDYSSATNAPGINADMMVSGLMQFNTKTKDIVIGDYFTWYGIDYRIINVDASEIDIGQQYGIINIEAKRVAGSWQ